MTTTIVLSQRHGPGDEAMSSTSTARHVVARHRWLAIYTAVVATISPVLLLIDRLH